MTNGITGEALILAVSSCAFFVFSLYFCLWAFLDTFLLFIYFHEHLELNLERGNLTRRRIAPDAYHHLLAIT